MIKLGAILILIAMFLLIFVRGEVEYRMRISERDFGQMALDVVSGKKDPVKAAEENHAKLVRSINYITGLILFEFALLTIGLTIMVANV